MTTGAGKYDDLAGLVREKASARFASVFVVDGNKGNGFSVQFVAATPEESAAWLRTVVTTLRSMADEIERDLVAIARGEGVEQAD